MDIDTETKFNKLLKLHKISRKTLLAIQNHIMFTVPNSCHIYILLSYLGITFYQDLIKTTF